MATELNLVSNLLRSHYVFYNRLNAEDESEDNKKLYEIAKNKMSMAAE